MDASQCPVCNIPLTGDAIERQTHVNLCLDRLENPHREVSFDLDQQAWSGLAAAVSSALMESQNGNGSGNGSGMLQQHDVSPAVHSSTGIIVRSDSLPAVSGGGIASSPASRGGDHNPLVDLDIEGARIHLNRKHHSSNQNDKSAKGGGIFHVEVLKAEDLSSVHLKDGSQLYVEIHYQEQRLSSQHQRVLAKRSDRGHSALFCNDFSLNIEEYYGPLEVIISIKQRRWMVPDRTLGSVSVRLSSARTRSMQLTAQISRAFVEQEHILGPESLTTAPTYRWADALSDDENSQSSNPKHRKTQKRRSASDSSKKARDKNTSEDLRNGEEKSGHDESDPTNAERPSSGDSPEMKAVSSEAAAVASPNHPAVPSFHNPDPPPASSDRSQHPAGVRRVPTSSSMRGGAGSGQERGPPASSKAVSAADSAPDESELNLEGGQWFTLWKKHAVRGRVCLCINYFSYADLSMEHPPNEEGRRSSRKSRFSEGGARGRLHEFLASHFNARMFFSAAAGGGGGGGNENNPLAHNRNVPSSSAAAADYDASHYAPASALISSLMRRSSSDNNLNRGGRDAGIAGRPNRGSSANSSMYPNPPDSNVSSDYESSYSGVASIGGLGGVLPNGGSSGAWSAAGGLGDPPPAPATGFLSTVELLANNPVWLHPMHVAAATGSATLLLALMKSRKNHPRMRHRQLPLHIAALCGHGLLVAILLYTKAMQRDSRFGYTQDSEGRTAVHYAILGCQRNFRRPPCRNRGVFTKLRVGHTIVSEAVFLRTGGNTGLLGRDSGINLSMPSHAGGSSLAPNDTSPIGVMLKRMSARSKKGLDKVDNLGCSPLIALCQRNIKEARQVALCLVKNGANINLRNKQGDTALTAATRCGNITLMNYLIETNESLMEMSNHNGRHPLCVAVQEENEKCVSFLLKKGARLWSSIVDGRTPLHLGAKTGNLAIMRLLLGALQEDELQEMILLADKQGLTALDIAAKEGQAEVDTLLQDTIDHLHAPVDGEELVFRAPDNKYVYINESNMVETFGDDAMSGDAKPEEINWNQLQQQHIQAHRFRTPPASLERGGGTRHGGHVLSSQANSKPSTGGGSSPPFSSTAQRKLTTEFRGADEATSLANVEDSRLTPQATRPSRSRSHSVSHSRSHSHSILRRASASMSDIKDEHDLKIPDSASHAHDSLFSMSSSFSRHSPRSSPRSPMAAMAPNSDSHRRHQPPPVFSASASEYKSSTPPDPSREMSRGSAASGDLGGGPASQSSMSRSMSVSLSARSASRRRSHLQNTDAFFSSSSAYRDESRRLLNVETDADHVAANVTTRTRSATPTPSRSAAAEESYSIRSSSRSASLRSASHSTSRSRMSDTST